MSRNGVIVDIETCHKDAEVPEYQQDGDAGMDLKAVEKIKDSDTGLWFRTGLKMAIPRGYVGLIFPRSSISEKSLILSNSVGVIDSGYRGEIQVRFDKEHDGLIPQKYVSNMTMNFPKDRNDYQVGDRIAQMIIMPYPKIEFVETESLNFDTSRGSGGFGSTNK
jgi:dUTP pyrophosphatase